MARESFEVIRGGQKYSTITPKKGDIVIKKITRSRTKSRTTSAKPQVKISGNTVFINGQGFSVAPSLQAKFIMDRTGGAGTSAQAAITTAKRIENTRIKIEQATKAASDKAAVDAAIQAKLSQITDDRIKYKLAQAEYKRIINIRDRLQDMGAKGHKTYATDNKTNDKLEVTIWSLKDGTKVKKIKNLETGSIEYVSYAPVKKGGRVYITGGVTKWDVVKGEQTARDIFLKTIITKSSDPNKIIVWFPNRRKMSISNKGTVIVGSKLAGHKYLFKDGVIIAIDGKSTHARDEFVSTPRVERIEKNGSFTKGFQKVAVSKRFQSKEVQKEQEKKEKKWNDILDKMKRGEKLSKNDISNYKEIVKFSPEKIIDKDVAKFAQITGGVIGTFVAPIPGAIIWAMGDTMENVRKIAGDGKKITKQEFGHIVLDSATKGAIMGLGIKVFGTAGKIASKRVLLAGVLRRVENNAIRSAINHGGILIKLVGRSGKNLISTYFMKDMLGNVFDVTAELKSGNFNNVLRKTIETGGAIGGYIGGSATGKVATKGALFVSGRLKPTIPEFATKRTQLDVMSKQLLSEGKIVLTRRGVYETGKGLSPRKDAWLDSKVKNPTKSIFWRFDKTLSKKDQAISPLPLFTKSKTGYYKMFKTNWIKNRGMSPIKRYIKTTAETPTIEDVVIRRIVKLKDIKDIKLRKEILRQYATTGKLNKATQGKVLKNPKFSISDKNREFGFHDENEFVTRAGFKFKGRTDISWTYDPSLGEYVPIVESLKTTNRVKNFLSVLNKKKIITRTDAKFIADNYAIKKQFGATSILPHKHSYTHMKQVENNIIKLMNKYPQYNSYWKRQYGSVAKAKVALKEAMWHDIGKGESASKSFGTPHGEKVWRVWKAGLLPKDIKLKPKVAKAIKKHETLDPRKLWYKVQNKVKLVSPEEKIVATADRLDLVRFGIKVDTKRLPLHDAMTKLDIKQKDIKFPNELNKIIAKIKIDKGVTKSDLKKISDFLKTKIIAKIKMIGFKTKKYNSYSSSKSKDAYKAGWTAADRIGLKAPNNYNVKYKGNKNAYVEGYKERYKGKYLINYKTGIYKMRPSKRIVKRPVRRPPKRPVKRMTKRQVKRPTKRPTKRVTKRPVRAPPRKPTTTKKPPAMPKKLPKKFKKRTISKAQPVYYIKVKRKGRMVNLTPRPLILRDAKDYLAYKLDKNIIRTAYFEPIGKSKNVVRLPKNIRGYYPKVKHKLRPYKIRVGKKKMLRNGFIEKSKYIGDSKSEIRQLQASRKRKAPLHKKTIKRKAPIKRRKKIPKRKAPVKRRKTSKSKKKITIKKKKKR